MTTAVSQSRIARAPLTPDDAGGTGPQAPRSANPSGSPSSRGAAARRRSARGTAVTMAKVSTPTAWCSTAFQTGRLQQDDHAHRAPTCDEHQERPRAATSRRSPGAGPAEARLRQNRNRIVAAGRGRQHAMEEMDPDEIVAEVRDQRAVAAAARSCRRARRRSWPSSRRSSWRAAPAPMPARRARTAD